MTDVSDERLAEMCCGLLGWPWWDGSGDLAGLTGMPPITVCATSRGLVVHRWAPDTKQATETIDIDITTLLIAALVRHAGPVDVGSCPECEGTGRHERVIGSMYRPCHSGGRHVVHATEAVLMAAPRRWTQEHVADGRVRARAGLYREAEREGAEVVDVDVRDARGLWVAAGTFVAPGHEGARVALRRLAKEWREHLPVLADWLASRGFFEEPCARGSVMLWARDRVGPLNLGDWLEDHGDCDVDWLRYGTCEAVPRPLAECPAVARWLLAWLDGECGDTLCALGREQFGAPGRQDCCAKTGLAIGSHLPAIEAHIVAAWEREQGNPT